MRCQLGLNAHIWAHSAFSQLVISALSNLKMVPSVEWGLGHSEQYTLPNLSQLKLEFKVEYQT